MKIHTTQDLSVITQQQLSPANSVSLSELRFTRKNNKQDESSANVTKEKKDLNYKAINAAVFCSGAFLITGLALALSKAKRPKIKIEDLKKTVKTENNVKVGDIRETAFIEKNWRDKFVNGKFFEQLLKWSENEPVMQAAISALVCILLRPATIMALPSKNGKENNIYASAHSVSSGIVGLFATAIIAQPFKSGAKYTLDKEKEIFKNFSEDALKRLCPKLDIKSIYKNGVSGERNAIDQWRFLDGNKFIYQFKDVEKIPVLKPLNEISAKTFREFHADVDWLSQKGKSFNDVVTKDGKRLYDVIDWDKLGLVVKQEYIGAENLSPKMLKECTGDARVLLKDLDKGFLETIIKDAEEGSNWKKLDINSVYKNNEVVDFRHWKDLGGKQWKLDLGSVYMSSPFDTVTYKPRISGRQRIEPTGEVKYISYLKNGKDGKLGTAIDATMVENDNKNVVLDKLITWTPDIITRPLVATTTIALIPWALKNIFHLEKKKPAENAAVQENKTQIKNNDIKPEKLELSTSPANTFKGKEHSDNNNSNISFKGAKPTPKGESPKGFMKIWDFIAKTLSKVYGKRMYESKTVNTIAGKLSKIPGGMTNHMASLGALLTSSVYIYRTLNKKDLDTDRRRTLAINQALCFIVPTICAYTVDKLLKNWTKEKIEYVYAGWQEHSIAEAKRSKLPEETIKAMEKDLGKKLGGVRTLVTLLIFSVIYRYVAPVLITPVANKIGDNITEKRRAKAIEQADKLQ